MTHAELMQQYSIQMQQLPSISVIAEFQSLRSEAELAAIVEWNTKKRFPTLSKLSDSDVQLIREKFSLSKPGRSAVEELFLRQQKEMLNVALDRHRTNGKHEYFYGNLIEVRGFSEQDDLSTTLQYGVSQPKLDPTNSARWVIKERPEDGVRRLTSTSKIRLKTMLPIGILRGPLHRSVQQRFPSGFDYFWESTPEINFVGKIDAYLVYAKRHPPRNDSQVFESLPGEKWLVAGFHDPNRSVVPEWIIDVDLPGRNRVDPELAASLIVAVNQFAFDKSAQIPNQVFIRNIVRFDQLASIEQFHGYPFLIDYVTPMMGEDNYAGAKEIRPFHKFQLQMTNLVVRPEDRPIFEAEDGMAFFDRDTGDNRVIGVTNAPLSNTRKTTRLVIWLAAFLVLVAGGIAYFKRK
jgi:hypothetical protein